MAIKIKRNNSGNIIEFQGSSQPAYWNNCLHAETDPADSSLINIINDVKTGNSSVKEYEFFKIPFTEFVDEEDNSFIRK